MKNWSNQNQNLSRFEKLKSDFSQPSSYPLSFKHRKSSKKLTNRLRLSLIRQLSCFKSDKSSPSKDPFQNDKSSNQFLLTTETLSKLSNRFSQSFSHQKVELKMSIEIHPKKSRTNYLSKSKFRNAQLLNLI